MTEHEVSAAAPLPKAYDNKIHPLVALRAWNDLRSDKEDTAQVFKMIGALKGKSTERAVARMKKSETGRRLLAEKSDIVPLLEDREGLRAMPDGSLGRVYLHFMESEGFTAQGLKDASAATGPRPANMDPDVEWMSNRLRDLHDIFHVLTGYGRDPLGELCVVSLGNVQNRNRGISFLSFMGRRDFRKRLPALPIDRCFKEAKLRGVDAHFLAAVDWESLLDKPMEEVRDKVGLPTAPIYGDTALKIETLVAQQTAAA